MRLLRCLLTLWLLLFMFSLIDLRGAIALFRETQWQWLAVAVILIQLQVVLSALRWRTTAVRLGQALSVPRSIREYYLATLGNLILPGGITGDALRVARNREHVGTALSVRSVVLERVAGQLALLAVAIPGWCLWPWLMGSDHERLTGLDHQTSTSLILTGSDHETSPLLNSMVSDHENSGPLILRSDHGASATGSAAEAVAGEALQYLFWLVPAGLVIIGFVAGLLWWLRQFGSDRLSRWLDSLLADMHRVWIADSQWMVQGVLSLAVVATYLGVFACSAAALHQELPLGGVLALVPLVLLSMVIPVSIGGWGIREATAVALWPLMGLSAESAVACSILYGLVSTIALLPGALLAIVVPHSPRGNR